MSQDDRQAELHERTQSLLQGPLKHARAAALAAALIPLASVASAQVPTTADCVASGGVCGSVWKDTNGNGIQEAGEPGVAEAKVTLQYIDEMGMTQSIETETYPDGTFRFGVESGTYTISVLVEAGWDSSPANAGADDTVDSDGIFDGASGQSYAEVTVQSGDTNTDFGLVPEAAPQPGTGTPGYWKNHPEAWPVNGITVGGVTYTKAQAIAWLGKVGKDKTTTMFSSLVPAMLNVMIGNDSSCIATAIAKGNDWMKTYGPVGSNVPASSAAWAEGEVWHRQMDAYNNGQLCAPHRD